MRGLLLGARWRPAMAATAAALAFAATGGATSPAVAAGSAVAKTAAAACGAMPSLPLPKDPNGALTAAKLPASVLKSYDDYANPIYKNPFGAKWKPKGKKPWTIGFSESYTGNSWRQELDSEVVKQAKLAEKKGIVKKLIFQNSNNNNATQIQQIRSMLQQGANIILTVAGSGTALNGVIKQAYQQGVPVVTLASGVNSPYAINLDENYALHSVLMALGVINGIGRKGNVITVQGLSGAPGNIEYQQAETPLFAACPNIKVVANIYGQWTSSIAKSQMLTALATHPEQINGIYQQGGMAQGILQALQQTGRSTNIALTDDGPTASFLAFWKANQKKGFKGIGVIAPPKTQALALFNVGMRMLYGKGLKVNTVVIPSEVIPASQISQFMQPGWTVNTDANGEPPTGTFLTDSYLDNFFVKKGAPNWGQGPGI